MLGAVIQWLGDLPQELIVVIMGFLPVSEVRGAIPLGLYFGMPLMKAFWLAVLGNTIFIAPALFLFQPVTKLLHKCKICARFFNWVTQRTKKRADKVQKYEALGLMLLVAIPLPMTGAWSGVVAASLFKIKFRYAFLAIVTGVFLAALIVSTLCVMGILSWKAVAG